MNEDSRYEEAESGTNAIHRIPEEDTEPQRRTWVYQRFDCLCVFMSVRVTPRSLLTLCFVLSASS